MSKYKNYDERFTFEGGSGIQTPIVMYVKKVDNYPTPSGDIETTYLFFKDENFTTLLDEQEIINSYLNGVGISMIYNDNEGKYQSKEYGGNVYRLDYIAYGSPDSKPEDLDFRLYVDADHSGYIAIEEDIELVAGISTETGEGGNNLI